MGQTGIWLAINFISLCNNASALLSQWLGWCQGFVSLEQCVSALEQGFLGMGGVLRMEGGLALGERAGRV